jgi:hypothetical protein
MVQCVGSNCRWAHAQSESCVLRVTRVTLAMLVPQPSPHLPAVHFRDCISEAENGPAARALKAATGLVLVSTASQASALTEVVSSSVHFCSTWFEGRRQLLRQCQPQHLRCGHSRLCFQQLPATDDLSRCMHTCTMTNACCELRTGTVFATATHQCSTAAWGPWFAM